MTIVRLDRLRLWGAFSLHTFAQLAWHIGKRLAQTPCGDLCDRAGLAAYHRAYAILDTILEKARQ
jgi:hypothetical protein